MNRFVKFFHELLHPHCVDCIHEFEDNRICASCETLRQQLDIANKNNAQLMNLLVEKNTPVKIIEQNKEEDEPIRLNKPVPWNVRRQMMEQESLRSAQILKDKEKEMKEIKKLEEELLPAGNSGE